MYIVTKLKIILLVETISDGAKMAQTYTRELQKLLLNLKRLLKLCLKLNLFPRPQWGVP